MKLTGEKYLFVEEAEGNIECDNTNILWGFIIQRDHMIDNKIPDITFTEKKNVTVLDHIYWMPSWQKGMQ